MQGRVSNVLINNLVILSIAPAVSALSPWGRRPCAPREVVQVIYERFLRICTFPENVNWPTPRRNIDSDEKWLFGHDGVAESTRIDRRAKDGRVPMSSGMDGVGHVVGGRAAWPVPMAAAGLVRRDALRHRPADRGRLAAGRRSDRRLEELLLFHLRRGTQGRIARRPVAAADAGAGATGSRLVFAIDDTPTKRYGPHVEGAGIHHNPTPGPADSKYVYGHIWVTLALVLRHRLWGTIGLPILAKLYIRRKHIGKLPRYYRWKFQTKLQQAADMIRWAAQLAAEAGKRLWIVTDGFYVKRPVLKVARALNIIVIGRLRKDAALWTLPPPLKKGERHGRGKPRKYGAERISLAERANGAAGDGSSASSTASTSARRSRRSWRPTAPPTARSAW